MTTDDQTLYAPARIIAPLPDAQPPKRRARGCRAGKERQARKARKAAIIAGKLAGKEG